MAKKSKVAAARAALVVRSFKLTREAEETLQGLCQDMTDAIGRKVSGSAVMRALLAQAAQHSPAQLVPFIEQELRHGVTWGRQ